MSDDYTPRWQDDLEVNLCFLCGTNYNFFNRRHHCRKCGRVVCGACSDQPIKYFPRTLIVTPSGTTQRSHPSQIYRTCDECVEEIRMIRSALFDTNLDANYNLGSGSDLDSHDSVASAGGYRGGSGNSRSIWDDDTNSIAKYSKTRTTTRRLDSSTNSSSSNLNSQQDDASDHNLCPVCATSMLDTYIKIHKKNIGDISNEDFEGFKEDHIKNCLTSYDFDYKHNRFNSVATSNPLSHPRNKMLVYNMPPIPKPKFETIPRNEDGAESTSYGTLKQYQSNDTIQNQQSLMGAINGDNEPLDLGGSFNIGSLTSNSTMQQNEKVDDAEDDNECVICLEELKPGDKVGRLECLCVFHYKCIKDWFNKKGYGECPVHYLQH